MPKSDFGYPPPKPFSTKINASFRNRQLIESNPSWISEKIFKRDFGEFKEPFIVAYGANRQMGKQNITKNELKDPIETRLSGLTELYDVNQALVELELAARAKKRRGKEQNLLKNLLYSLAEILPGNKTKNDIEIVAGKFVDDKFMLSNVYLRTFSGLVPISALSIGYRTMLAWILDLTWRLSLEYPDSKNPRHEPAIVLIDEIDLHLHPHWQIKLMETLGELFKNTQFIATAHSPLMVQSKPNANFAVIKQSGTEVIIENDPGTVRGWRVDQILNSDYFSISNSRDLNTQKLYEQRDELLEIPMRSSTEESQLRRIEEKILSLPTASDPDDIEAMKLIREAALLLKNEKAQKDDSN